MSQSTSELLNAAKGQSPGTLLMRGLGAWILAVWGSIITGTQEVFRFLFLPFELFINVAQQNIDAFFVQPGAQLVPAGIAETIEGLQGWGLFGLPTAVSIALLSMGIVVVVLALGITSNWVPGVPVDNPILSWTGATAEEEEENDG